MPRIEPLLAGVLLLSLAATAAAAPPNTVVGLPAAPVASVPGTQVGWPNLDAAQKREARARYAAWQALPESEKQRLRQTAATLAALPAAQREALQARFAGMDQLHRDGWLLGPQLGSFYSRLQPLFGFLPAAERAPMMALLRALDVDQLEQLSLISQRTPPQERDALRAQLLALPPAQRADWLRQRVGQ